MSLFRDDEIKRMFALYEGHGLTPTGFECVHCGYAFDEVKTRYVCPFCKQKNSCCEGAPAKPIHDAESVPE